jgi:uncharacterized protein
MSELERRITIEKLEVRQEGQGPAQISGYAAVFNSLSEDLGNFREMVLPGAFKATLAAEPDVRATIDHQGGLLVIGRTRNKTLSLREDERGLRAIIEPPNTAAGRDALTLVREGYVDQMSFAFRVIEDEWDTPANGTPLRKLRAVDLEGGDVSIVTRPAYPATSAEVRARIDQLTAASQAGTAVADKDEGAEVRAARLRRLNLEIADIGDVT